MFQYISRRVLQFIPVFFGVTLALFLIANYMPGADPIQMRFGERTPPPAIKAQLIEQYGLDQPWYVQYGKYLAALSPVKSVEGQVTWTGPDLGTSIYTGRPVTTILAETYPYTLRLALVAIIIEIIVGVGAGIISAIKQYSFWDVFLTLSTSILVSLPVFWLGLMLQYFFGIWLKNATNETFYLPISGASGVFPDWAYLIMPGITLASVSTAYAARIMRSQLLEVTGQDYIRTAYAKGLSGRNVLWQSCAEKRAHPCGDLHRSRPRRHVRGRGAHRDRLQLARSRVHHRAFHLPARLPGRLRRRDGHPVRRHDHQPARRHLLRLP
jgi:ABC-type dipeptide/oligopeptide/nickel transport system permease component